MSGAGVFDFTRSLAHVFDQLPVAPGAGPFDFGRRSGGLFVSTVSLVKDAGCGGFESFMAEFTFEVGLTGSIAGEFMDVPKFSRCGAGDVPGPVPAGVPRVHYIEFHVEHICAHRGKYDHIYDMFQRWLW